MHEAALAHGILELIEAQGRQHPFHRVTQIRLAVGALATVEPEALRTGLICAALGSVAEGAVVVIERPAGQAHCWGCNTAVTLLSRADGCPRCGGTQLLVTGGDDLRVVDLVVDDGPTAASASANYGARRANSPPGDA